MPLTDIACKGAKPLQSRKKLSDGGGLQLWVEANGSRLWRPAYRFDGKQKLLARGVDPSAERKKQKLARRADTNTFHDVATEFVEKSHKEGLADITLGKMEWLLAVAVWIYAGQGRGTHGAPKRSSGCGHGRCKHGGVRGSEVSLCGL